MLVWWDYLVAAGVFVIFAVLAWVLFTPPDDEWLPIEFLEDDRAPRRGPSRI